ncbi:hypothetical protein FYK61_11575 [Xanthomonas citri]|uniref:hypothetical protein n=1 Tax=Xanthomonas citri TaxID=346 RepID=UPI001884AEF7|nr:hypothetical protein [Xanthomonas citri]QOY21987.1 hypothetical protein FYK61_11575 [Xanthomonas citri]QQK68129.1 hypothetical protein G3566_11560 [Xanthomonas citri]
MSKVCISENDGHGITGLVINAIFLATHWPCFRYSGNSQSSIEREPQTRKLPLDSDHNERAERQYQYGMPIN